MYNVQLQGYLFHMSMITTRSSVNSMTVHGNIDDSRKCWPREVGGGGKERHSILYANFTHKRLHLYKHKHTHTQHPHYTYTSCITRSTLCSDSAKMNLRLFFMLHAIPHQHRFLWQNKQFGSTNRVSTKFTDTDDSDG